jgi:hypothetical protein
VETYRTGTGQLIQVHEQDLCHGDWCVIHKPKPGRMAEMPTHWREDRAIMERICTHGVGHPAIEQMEHWRATDQWWQSVHGCDGCCVESKTRGEYPGKVRDVSED